MLRRSFCFSAALSLTLPLSVCAEEPAEAVSLLVIGAGAAGLSAAVSAAQQGLKNILVIDKAPFIGGHSSLSGGSVNAVDPEIQLKEGIKDSPEFWSRQIMEEGGFTNEPKLVKTLVENAYPTLNWLRELGIPFDDRVFEAWGGKYKRAHSAGQKRNGMTYVRVMNQKARALGVQIRLRCKALELLAQKGSVAGAVVESKDGVKKKIFAKAVLIATGGFTANVQMRERYDPRLSAEFRTTANPSGKGFDGSTGDGILMAEKLGALTADMDAIQLIPLRGGRLLNYAGGDMFVDGSGRRFTDETQSITALSKAYLNLTSKPMWVITDSLSNKGLDLEAKLLSGEVQTADSVEEMADKMGVSRAQLRSTLNRYNDFARRGKDEDFGRTIFTQTIEKPPFYFGKERFDIHYSCGGLRINEVGEVLGKEEKAIPNLYAVGEVTGGIHGRGRLGGDSLIACFVFGKLTGEKIAKSLKSQSP